MPREFYDRNIAGGPDHNPDVLQPPGARQRRFSSLSDVLRFARELIPTSPGPGIVEAPPPHDKRAQLREDRTRLGIPHPSSEGAVVWDEQWHGNSKVGEVIKFFNQRILRKESFPQQRDGEIFRLQSLFKAFSRKFGVALELVAVAREQYASSFMTSELRILPITQEELQKNGQSVQGQSFFETRQNYTDEDGNEIQFNASGISEIFGYPLIFSVMKRTSEDSEGTFGVDYPVYRISEEIFHLVDQAKKHADTPLDDVLAMSSELGSLRIHDWFHAVFIYDTAALTEEFAKWSKDIFFTQHHFTEAGRINYELMSDMVHHSVWQEIFAQNPDAKKFLLRRLKTYLDQLNVYRRILETKHLASTDQADKSSHFLAYLAIRSLYHIMPYHDESLREIISASGFDPEAFTTMAFAQSLEVKPYLDKVYEDVNEQKFPFGTRGELTFAQIMAEYVEALKIELSKVQGLHLTAGAFEVAFNPEKRALYEKLPASIKQKMAAAGFKRENFNQMSLVQLSAAIESVATNYGPEFAQQLVDRLEVGSRGEWYLKINRAELVLATPPLSSMEGVNYKESVAKEVVHHKSALLVQVPLDHAPVEVTLIRGKAMGLAVTGTKQLVQPGEVLVVNFTEPKIVNQIIAESNDAEGQFSIDIFLKKIADYRLTYPELGDMYPYSQETLRRVYKVRSVTQPTELNIKPGLYSTFRTRRWAMQAGGPVSLDDPRQEGNRLKILSGAICEFPASSISDDLYPVDGNAYNRFYSGAGLLDLPMVTVKPTFWGEAGLNQAEVADKGNQALQTFLDQLNRANSVQLYGQRGKPQLHGFNEEAALSATE